MPRRDSDVCCPGHCGNESKVSQYKGLNNYLYYFGGFLVIAIV